VEKLIATVGDVATYLDDGTITPSGSPLSENTTGRRRYRELERMSNKEFKDIFSNIGKDNTGRPSYFTRTSTDTGSDVFMFDKYADTDTVYELNYYRHITQLSEAAPRNWWTNNAQEALLYTCLSKAGPYLGDDPRIQLWEQIKQEAVRNVRRKDIRERISGQNTEHISINVF